MNKYSYFELYFEDESRLGLMTKNGKYLITEEIKPKCKFQQVFKSTWLFGAFSPVGDNFLLELSHCDGVTFQYFIDEFSKQNENEFKIIVLDNAAFYKAK